jgi:hypothetical protein
MFASLEALTASERSRYSSRMRVLIAVAALAAPLSAQQPIFVEPSPLLSRSAPPTAVYHGRDRQLDVRIPKITTTPVVDGRLDDASWAEASMLTGFSQYHPVDRQPAADSTEVLVMYTDYAIYFGIKAFETHGAVAAALADRDKIFSSDNVELLLDTFNDRRRALVFTVNALGIQSDGTFAEGSGTDRSPDFLFESKGRVTDYGFEVEVRIPFKNIRYQQTKVQQWGVQVIRRVMHSGQEQTWTPAERGAASFLEQSGKLLDLTSLKQGLVMDVNPVMTTTSRGAPMSATDPAWRYKAQSPEFGGTVRWGITPNMSLNATMNPDFSQVESDVGQTIFDPRAAISFPEKRPFFLESNENFQVPNGLIYTRRIVLPQGAARLSGKVGGWNVGLLSAIDDTAQSPTGDTPFYNIVRLRRDVGPGSNAGMVYTDKVDGENSNRVIGFDSRQRIGQRYVLSSQVAGSFTTVDGAHMDGRPLFDVSLSKTGREKGFNLIVEGTHPEFIASSGFLSRTGIARAVFQPRRTWFPKNSVFQSISFQPISDNTWEWDRFTRGTEPNDIKLNTSTTAQLRGGWFAHFYTWTETFKYPAFLYEGYFVEVGGAAGAPTDTVPFVGTDRLTNIGVMTAMSTPQWKKFSGNVELVGGQDDNFDEWSSAWIMYTTISADWRPTDKIRVNARHLEQRVHRKSDGSLVRISSIPRVKVEYQVSRPIFIRVVGQYSGLKVDSLRDDSRSNDPVLIQTATGFRRATAINRGGLRADWLFSYQPTPGTVFFMGYGSSLASDEFRPTGMARTSDGFFLKASYVFRAR